MTFLSRFVPRKPRTVTPVLAAMLAGLLGAGAPALAKAPAKVPTKTPAVRAASAAGPWLYRGSDVPQDKAWVFGVLPNGLRYAVRRNGVPPGQVSVRMLIDAGSLYETDPQRGYAHLIEHLTFRDSKYLKAGEAIPAWQRLGATFGSDTNAETSPTQTVYKLDIPDVSPAKLDETFRLLSGMITAPIFTDIGVKTEVPIVLAEMRERSGPQTRIVDGTRAVFFAGQPLGSRSPIGTEETLNAATPAKVKAFHDAWYRPDNAVIVVAGDADPQALIARIKQWFGAWKGAKLPGGKRPPHPDFGAPKAPVGGDPANPVGEAKVMVEPDLPRVFNYAVLRPWHQVHDTIVYNQGLMIDRLGIAIINRRLEGRARSGGSYLSASVESQRISRSADATLVTVTPLTDDWKAAAKDVRAVIADALATPPSEEEIAREVAEFDVAFKVPVETQETLAGSKLAEDITDAVDIRETVANPDTVYGIFRSSIPLFTPASVLEHTRALFKGTVVRSVLITPSAADGTEADLRSVLLAPVAPSSGSRLAASSLSFKDLPPIGEPGKIVSAESAGLLGIERIELANGVRALLWSNDAEPGRVIVRVHFGGGYAVIDPRDAVYASLGETALMDTGFGNVGREDLDRLATGRKLSLDFDIQDTSFKMSADTRSADLADQLYLFAAKLAVPRWDANPVVRAQAAARLAYEATNASAASVLQRDVRWLLKDGDPRYALPNPAELAKASPDGFRRVWSALLKQGPVEVDIFGDFKREETVAALERTFGALPARDPLPATGFAPRVPAPVGDPLTLTHHGDANTAAGLVAWPTGGGNAGLHEARQLELLAQVFNNRLFDAMREKIGASYAPQVSSTWPLDLPSGGYFAATTQLRPGDLTAFFAATDKIATDLATTPPTADEIARVTEPMKQLITRASTGNGFYMFQLEGGAFAPEKFSQIRSILADYSQIAPERLQLLARRYLVADKAWRMQVVPGK
ncbi:M16 family metallopeptidase [Novosphingobium fuchskuhlense]|uniref:M16 family metallopeptidase n=1 Tax=Novosphingobium fuchskuhlense TaxID=1117702 RepID=UPI0009EAC340|nr:M16 family metallopeptidase [Novosphingobium fuchskuhlense]